MPVRIQRQPRFIDGLTQQIPEAQFPRPFIEVGAVQRCALDFEDAQHVQQVYQAVCGPGFHLAGDDDEIRRGQSGFG